MSFTPDTSLPCAASPSPNHGDRRGRAIDSVILHYTGMATAEAARAWLCNPASEVSCHYLVYEDGRLAQLVPEARRAWHAGRSSWKGETDLNSVSIGIEIVNTGHAGGLPPFPEAQIAAVIALCRDIAARRGIAPERFLAHSDIAPGRKIDPGEAFPWATLAAHGIGLAVPVATTRNGLWLAIGAEGRPVTALQHALAAFGFDLRPSGSFDGGTAAIVAAFQRHFRPGCVDGAADPETQALLQTLPLSTGARNTP